MVSLGFDYKISYDSAPEILCRIERSGMEHDISMIVDSGAEAVVIPRWWGEEMLGLWDELPKERVKNRFANASGNPMDGYGPFNMVVCIDFDTEEGKVQEYHCIDLWFIDTELDYGLLGRDVFSTFHVAFKHTAEEKVMFFGG